MNKHSKEILDLSRLTEVQIDAETDGFQPRWDNTILLVAYDQQRTFVLTSDGRYLVLGRPLQETLIKFANDNDVDDYIMRALYGMIGQHKGRGYIAGNNRLVPTHGKTNTHVAYYMADCLDNHFHCKHRDMELATFVSEGQAYSVYFDTSAQTFSQLIRAADRVASLQLGKLTWDKHNFGDDALEERRGVRTFHDGQRYRQDCHDIRYAVMMELLRQTCFEYCSEEEQQQAIDKLKRLIKPDL
ncbi:hypothetical protein [Limosilactobacillus kribbianus]|uniref:hypothetical protein n=1 Tax=Limosilactobacillus kribbianus TaxID=2982695 RepID=UPI00226500A7|nr:hypothetical protein [Limosilactobacillus kribbianus]